jgi:hypothetical protein
VRIGSTRPATIVEEQSSPKGDDVRGGARARGEGSVSGSGESGKVGGVKSEKVGEGGGGLEERRGESGVGTEVLRESKGTRAPEASQQARSSSTHTQGGWNGEVSSSMRLQGGGQGEASGSACTQARAVGKALVPSKKGATASRTSPRKPRMNSSSQSVQGEEQAATPSVGIAPCAVHPSTARNTAVGVTQPSLPLAGGFCPYGYDFYICTVALFDWWLYL